MKRLAILVLLLLLVSCRKVSEQKKAEEAIEKLGKFVNDMERTLDAKKPFMKSFTPLIGRWQQTDEPSNALEFSWSFDGAAVTIDTLKADKVVSRRLIEWSAEKEQWSEQIWDKDFKAVAQGYWEKSGEREWNATALKRVADEKELLPARKISLISDDTLHIENISSSRTKHAFKRKSVTHARQSPRPRKSPRLGWEGRL